MQINNYFSFLNSLGFTPFILLKKLGEKYIGHYTEEMEWVEKFNPLKL